MPTLPHDIADLHLAPLLLTLDERLEEMGRLTVDELRGQVAVISDQPDWTRELRSAALLVAVGRFTDCHGWTLAHHPRGLQVSHDDHRVVLGVPTNFGDYLLGASIQRGWTTGPPRQTLIDIESPAPLTNTEQA
jgi:hypothetical protein